MKGYSMKTLNSEEILALPFGTKIKIVYHKSKYHSKNEAYNAVVFGEKIGYEDGLVDHLRIIAEQVYNNECKVHLLFD
mgnify:FL=1